MRTTYGEATVRLYHLDEGAEFGMATTLCYAPLAEAMAMAARQPEEIRDALYIATENDVIAWRDLAE